MNDPYNKVTEAAAALRRAMSEANWTPEQEFTFHSQEQSRLCQENEWGDHTAYARTREIQAAGMLGHRVALDYSGADAINQKEEGVEYKSTIAKNCKGRYSGLSVQPTWAQQRQYLISEKILPYPEHYFNRFENGVMVESWKLTGQQVYDILLPKLERAYKRLSTNKDPRLSAAVCWTEIKNNGVQIIKNGKRVK